MFAVLPGLMVLFFLLSSEPAYTTTIDRPDQPFGAMEIEVLELDLSLHAGRISPYHKALVQFWRKEYPQLLDVDSFISALGTWAESDNEAAENLSYLAEITRKFYVEQLNTRILTEKLPALEKEFFKLFLFYILNEDKSVYISCSALNTLAEQHLSQHPGSPYHQLIQGYIFGVLPPVFWTLGGSIFAVVETLPRERRGHCDLLHL